MSISLARYIDKPRLDRRSDWHFMVPEGNSGTHGHTQVFINRDKHVMGCHVSSNLMEKLNSLTWVQRLQQDGIKIQHGLTFRWPIRQSPSIHLTSPLPSVSTERYITPLLHEQKLESYGQLLYPSNPSDEMSPLLFEWLTFVILVGWLKGQEHHKSWAGGQNLWQNVVNPCPCFYIMHGYS